MKRAVKKCILLLAGLALAAALSGCTVFDSSVEQLFTLPRMAPEYAGLSQQLDSLISQGYEYFRVARAKTKAKLTKRIFAPLQIYFRDTTLLADILLSASRPPPIMDGAPR